jgi:hypothetical protein
MKTIVYPWVGIGNKGLIVRFDSYNTGEVIEAGQSMWRVGDYRSSWLMSSFKAI